ncbi:hypothetical protein [Pseudokineococcus lusitanus]|uniref:Uncharacterized protein n=1 Tax=Pseudokineococcus lusitanus TaxID=763993 RepID=A0A3N1HRB5_9ACTN|nr:hypothetical protein [Pseudokineococcus lusitanus]ROP45041.1 hypothetical protein EDC03_1171 [Pseudokineococcus lusitanus]
MSAAAGTTTRATTRATTTATTGVRTADGHDVAAALAATTDRDAAARAVRRLERAACAPLGGTDGEPLVVLQRRAARALGRLAPGSGRALDEALAELRGGVAPVTPGAAGTTTAARAA